MPNTALAGRLFNFQPAATVRNNDPGQTAVTAYRRNFGNQSAAIDVTNDLALPTLVSGTWVSPLQQSAGLPHVAFALTSTQGGSVVLSKFLDTMGQISAGSATAAMVANTALVLDHSSTTLLQSWSIAINNTAASQATLSNALCLLSKYVDFQAELYAGVPTEEMVSAATHCTKILLSLSDPSLECVFTTISILLVNVISNYNWHTLEARDSMPDLIAEQLRRNLARADDFDRKTGGNA